jgi:hypothetical protein
MAAQTLTNAQARWMYNKGLAILEGTYTLITRTAEYDWNPTVQQYERISDGLRVQHRWGARWNGQRFVRCGCNTCRAHKDLAEQVDVLN